MITEDAEEKADDVPDADKNTIIAPVACFSDKLSVQH
jgi:hypothetical protein